MVYQAGTKLSRSSYSLTRSLNGSKVTVRSNPSSGIGTPFQSETAKQYGVVEYAGAGTSVYEGSKTKGGAIPLVQRNPSYKPGLSGEGSFTTSSGETVQVRSTPISETAQTERQKQLRANESRLSESQRAELKMQREGMFKKPEEQPVEDYQGRFGNIVVQKVSLSPGLARKYASEVMKQSIPISEDKETTLNVYTQLGETSYSVQPPTTPGKAEIFIPKVKSERGKAVSRFAGFVSQMEEDTAERREKFYQRTEYLTPPAKYGLRAGYGLGVGLGEEFGMLTAKSFLVTGALMTEEFRGVALQDLKRAVPETGAILKERFDPTTVKGLTNIGLVLGATYFYGSTLASRRAFAKQYKVKGEKLPEQNIVKMFNKPYSQKFTVQPKGQSVQGKNIFSQEQLVVEQQKAIISGNILSEKIVIKYPTYNQKLTVLSPASPGRLQVSGIGINAQQITVASIKGRGLYNYDKISFTNEKGITTSDFYRVSKVTGKAKLVGTLGNQRLTPGIKYTEPTFKSQDPKTVSRTNKITQFDYETGLQRGVGTLKGKLQVKGLLKSDVSTVTQTKATAFGEVRGTETPLSGGSGKARTKSLFLEEVRYNYLGEPTTQQQNIFIKKSGDFLNVDTARPVISETSQVTMSKQTGYLSVSKKPSFLSNLKNMKVTFSKDVSSPRRLVTIKVRPEPQMQVYDTAMRNDMANMESTLFKVRLGAKKVPQIYSQTGTITTPPQSATATRTVTVQKPTVPTIDFGETTVYTPVSPMLQTPGLFAPVVYTGSREINIGGIFSGSGSKSGESFREININSPVSDSRYSVQPIGSSSSISGSNVDVFSGMSSRNESNIRDLNINKPASDVRSESKSETVQQTITEQVYRSVFKPLTRERTPFIPGFEPPKPPEPKPPILFFGKNNNGVFSSPGFNVLVKSRGVFKKINTQPLTRISAINLGSKVVDYSSSASFKLVPSRSPAISYSTKINPLFSKKFYTGKNNIFVEKRANRIDAPGELQEITFKGIGKSSLSRRIRKLYGR